MLDGTDWYGEIMQEIAYAIETSLYYRRSYFTGSKNYRQNL